jgi:uncharacterized oligopeptide transporter (OPT) family protein
MPAVGSFFSRERVMKMELPPQEAATPEAAHVEHGAREWLENVYQGDTVRQLSVRSIVTGMLIGGVMSISNLYVGLKTGWGLGVTITACIIAYAVFKALEAVVPRYRKDPFTILENYTMSSAASAAGYMASAGLVSALPALVMLTGRELLWYEIMAWLAAVSFLGVFMAIPLKRQLINIDALPFPSGIATAETLRSMHSSGIEAVQKAKSLLWGAVAGAGLAFWRDGLPAISSALAKIYAPVSEFLAKISIPESFPLYPGGRALLEKYTLGYEGSLIMIAAGAIMGIRVGVSLLLGAVFYYGLLGPWLVASGIATPGYRGIVSWTLWPATAMMVTSGLLAFAMRWRTVVRAFSGLTKLIGSHQPADDPLADIEVPGSWFVIGTTVSGLACVLLGHYMFDIAWWMGVLAVIVTFMLSIVAARATGETDVTPIGAMGKITQLMYGAIAPSNITTNLMTASITAGAACHSADLLTDLKSGYLLGGNPRKQTISQLLGVVAGTLVCVPVYMIIARPEKLGSAELPAPAAKVWAGVAEMLANGLDSLPKHAVVAMAIGGALGVLLTLAEALLPQRIARWLPSATGLGIAGVIPAFNSISMFLGALVAWWLSREAPATGEKYTIPVSSGLIAGESLMGVAIILCMQGPALIEALRHAFSSG